MNIGPSVGLEAALAFVLFPVLIIAFFAALVHNSQFKLRRKIDDLEEAVRSLEEAVSAVVGVREQREDTSANDRVCSGGGTDS